MVSRFRPQHPVDAERGNEIVALPLAEATAKLKLVPRDRYAVAGAFFG